MAIKLVDVYRGSIVECEHWGDIAVVDTGGKLVAWAGDPGHVTYMRSSAKPIQALALVESGAYDELKLTPRELAIACASHSGQPEHVDAVRSLLAKAGVEETALQCGIHPPGHQPSAIALYAAGQEPTAVHNNCSGKHAGMLALAKFLGYDLDTYLNPDHPLQERLLQVVSSLSGEPQEGITRGTDGCGVPVFGLRLRGMATAFARLADPSALSPLRRESLQKIAAAMQAHPLLIGGSGRFDTRLLEAGGNRLVLKGGAEAVHCLGHVQRGFGLAVKIRDGRSRAIPPVVLRVLDQLGALEDDLREALADDIRPLNTNHRGEDIGQLQAVFELNTV